MITIAAIVHFSTYLASDLGWHLHLAEGMVNDNGTIYQDFFEVNTPAIIYITQISVVLSHLFSINLVLGLNLFNFALALIILVICLRIVADQSANHVKKYLLPIFVCYSLFIVPLTFPATEFGQKEHVFILLIAPYLMRFSMQSKASKLDAMLASFGIMIKPFFIVIYLAMLLVKTLERKIDWSRELLIIGGQITFYSLLFYYHTSYFGLIIPIALESYTYLNITDDTLLSKLYYFYILSLFTCFMYALSILISIPTVSHKDRRLLPVLIASLLIVLIQGKFFWYHYIPFISVSVIYFGFLFTDVKRPSGPIINFIKVVNLVIIMGLLSLGNFCQIYDMYKNDNTITKSAYPEMFELLSHYQNERIMVLSPNISPIFPIVNYLNLQWDMKEHSMQIIEGVFKNLSKTNLGSSKAVEYAVRDVIQALKMEPKVVIVNKPRAIDPNNKWLMLFFFKRGYDYVSFFCQYDDFKLLWSNYSLKSEIGNDYVRYDVYKRD